MEKISREELAKYAQETGALSGGNEAQREEAIQKRANIKFLIESGQLDLMTGLTALRDATAEAVPAGSTPKKSSK